MATNTPTDQAPPDVNRLVDQLFRHLAGPLVSRLTRILGSGALDLAEAVVQEAMLKACQAWPHTGVPDNPAGWLATVARHQALDLVRRDRRFRERAADIARWLAQQQHDAADHPDAEAIDDQLRLMFICCHPSLSRKSQIALTLKTISGFSVPEVARALLSREDATHKLLTRARQRIRQQHLPFELPPSAERGERLGIVLDVVYLIFNEGYSATHGDALVRQDLCDEALRLAGLLLQGSLATDPKRPTINALIALMLLQSSHLPARTDASGDIVRLSDQDRRLWDQRRIAVGVQYLRESAAGEELSPYHLEAHIAACHAAGPTYDGSDWPQIVVLYDQLASLTGSPIVRLNRAVAVSMVEGPEAGLRELERIADEPSLQSYHLLPAAFADLYRRLGDRPRALAHYRKALALAANAPERRYLERRVEECAD